MRPLSALRPGALPVAQPTVSPSESAQLFTHGLCLTLHRAPACDAEAGLALAIPARRKSDAAALPHPFSSLRDFSPFPTRNT